MDAKLTLKLDRKVIDQTKKLAAQRGTSVSRMVETYFRGLTVSQKRGPQPKGVVAELAGIAASAQIKDRKRDYAEHLEEKYK